MQTNSQGHHTIGIIQIVCPLSIALEKALIVYNRTAVAK